MLRLLPKWDRNCAGMHRRHFLEVGALAGLGLSLPTLLAGKKVARANPARGDVNCILVWSQGGISHHDTFDPKPDAPPSVRGEFAAIDTAIPGVKFAEVAPRFAQELNRFALLRGWNPLNGSHGTADQYCLSGRKFNPSVTYPCYGSVVSHELGFKTAMPPFMQLGPAVDHTFGGGIAGFLPAEHNPFVMLADPNASPFNVRDITPPSGIDLARVERRRNMLTQIDAVQRQIDVQPAAFDALDENYRTALEMITSSATKEAFNLDSEDAALRDGYGRTTFGQSCLLARRLVESGVRFVTVTSGGWDHHTNVFNALRGQMPAMDQGITQLLIDLDQRGMLDSTVVLWMSDFGRTPKINSAGGRDHWASAGFALMAGAGIPGGSVLGETDGEGGRPTKNEYFTEDVAATLYTKLGIPLDLIITMPDGRPGKIVEGQPIKEWI